MYVVLILGLRLKIIHTFTVYGAPPYNLTPIAKWLMIASTHNLTQDTRVVADTHTVESYSTRHPPSEVGAVGHYTHTDTLARSRFAAPLNIRFPRCDIQSPLDGPISIQFKKACLQESSMART